MNRLKTGLQKLSEANELVNTMKEELIILGPQIEAKEEAKFFLKYLFNKNKFINLINRKHMRLWPNF